MAEQSNSSYRRPPKRPLDSGTQVPSIQNRGFTQPKHYTVTPHRHYSADSPLTSRSRTNNNNNNNNSSQTINIEDDDGDIILWQSMSPSGTLRHVVRQRTAVSQRDAAADDSALTQGFVQQFIDSRNNVSITSPTLKGGRTRRDTLYAPSLLTSSSAASSFLDDDNTLDHSSIERTPLAQRRAKPIPRPLTVSKSERNIHDKRQILSSLLQPPSPSIASLNSPMSAASNSSASGVMRTKCTVVDYEEGTPTRRGKSNINNDTPTLIDDVDKELDEFDINSLLGDLDQLDDGNMDDLFDQLNEDDFSELQPTTTKKKGEDSTHRYHYYEKCLTLHVEERYYSNSKTMANPHDIGVRPQKYLKVYSQQACRERIILLRDLWYSTPIVIGDYINIVGKIPDTEALDGNSGLGDRGEVIISEHTPGILPVLSPDTLVSCTHLSDSFTCMRRAVLKERIREIPDGTEPNSIMLVGTLLHDLFQSCALKNRWDDDTVSLTIRNLIKDNITRLWECQIDEPTIYTRINEIVPVYQQWAGRYMHSQASQDGVYTVNSKGASSRLRPPESDADVETVALSKILNIEENAWSPKFGLKGKIDLTVLAQYSDGEALIQPFELKTGRNTKNAAHAAQLMLYTLLLADRYGVDIASGLLYYPRSGELVRVPRRDNELRALMAARNEMIPYLVQNGLTSRPLPSMLGQEHMCKRCAFKPTCFVTHKSLEEGNANTCKVSAQEWVAQVDGLNEGHLEFVRKWMGMIDSEESDMMKYRAELWNMHPEYRESNTRRCLANLRLESIGVVNTGVTGSYSRYRQAFVPIEDESGPSRRAMADGQISVGDPIVVSSQRGHYAFMIGYVHELEFGRIVVAGDRPVRGIPKRLEGFDAVRNQDYESIMEIRQGRNGAASETTELRPDVPESALQDTFRIDKDEMSSAMARVRANVMRMFVAAGGNPKCRRLVVDLDQPAFNPIHANIEKRIQEARNVEKWNAGQTAVVRKVLSATDYALVMGMPGTGKTTTIASLVGLLVDMGKSVLLASYTHTAVDNILLKLKERSISAIRLGNRNKIHPLVSHYHPFNADLSSVQQLDDYFRKTPVVATTCLGVSHPLFTIREFDYCIVDEASQVTLPVCLGPLLEAKTFVLVGDHYQLPPLVRNKNAIDKGMATSLFKRLCEAHPSAVVRLEYQYRMNYTIQRLANNHIYDGHLRCGSLKVARQQIKYDKQPIDVVKQWPFEVERAATKPKDSGLLWAIRALDPEYGSIFIDTDDIGGIENRFEGSDLVHNFTEVKVIKVLTSILKGCGVKGQNVGLLSSYRSQTKQLEIEHGVRGDLEDKLKPLAYETVIPSSDSDSGDSEVEEKESVYDGMEVHTIDRYQGRDADVIIISWVRSNSGKAIGNLLRDWHRINVAITRARLKLIMVGSASTLRRSPLFSGMLDTLKRADAVVKIPALAEIPATVSIPASKKAQGQAQNATAGSALLRNLPITRDIMSE